jgi:hypothetical protein
LVVEFAESLDKVLLDSAGELLGQAVHELHVLYQGPEMLSVGVVVVDSLLTEGKHVTY